MVLKTKLQNKFSDLTSPTEYWFQQLRPYSPLYDEAFLRKSIQINPFHATGLFLHPLKTENFGFLMFSGGIERDHVMKWVKYFS